LKTSLAKFLRDERQEIGENNIFGNLDDALNRARAHLGLADVAPPPFAVPTVMRETPAGGTRTIEPDARRTPPSAS
jgi:hypothetical protein